MSEGCSTIERMSDSWMPAAARLAGIVTTAELLRSGVSPERIRTLSRRGELLTLARGVHAPTGQVAAERAHGPGGDHLLRVAAVIARAGDGPAPAQRPM